MYFFAPGMIKKFRFAHMKGLHGNKRLQHNFIPNDHLVSDRTKFIERLYNEPGTLAARIVQIDSHGILFYMSGQFFVHSEIFVAFYV
jgi:hypothetical protein